MQGGSFLSQTESVLSLSIAETRQNSVINDWKKGLYDV
jgi:hypothetical protein